MDNFSLRTFTPSMMTPMMMLINPDLLTRGASISVQLDPWRGLESTIGIDNLFGETYAEHISRAGAAISGFTQIRQVNEPDRVLWARVSTEF